MGRDVGLREKRRSQAEEEERKSQAEEEPQAEEGEVSAEVSQEKSALAISCASPWKSVHSESMAICFLLSSHGQLMCNFIVPWFWIRVNIVLK